MTVRMLWKSLIVFCCLQLHLLAAYEKNDSHMTLQEYDISILPQLSFEHCFDAFQIDDYYSYAFWEYVERPTTTSGSSSEVGHIQADVQELLDVYFLVMQTPLLILSNTMPADTPHAHVVRYNVSCFLPFELPAAIAHVEHGHEGASVQLPIDENAGPTDKKVISGHTSVLRTGDIVRVAFNQVYNILYHDIDIIWLQPELLLARPEHVILRHAKRDNPFWLLNGMFNLHNSLILDCILTPVSSFDLFTLLNQEYPHGDTHNVFGAMRINACFAGLNISLVPFNITAKPQEVIHDGPLHELDALHYLCRNEHYIGWRKYSSIETELSKCLPPPDLLNECISLHLSMSKMLVDPPNDDTSKCVLSDLIKFHAQPSWDGTLHEHHDIMLHDLPWLLRADQFRPENHHGETSLMGHVLYDLALIGFCLYEAFSLK